MKFSIKLPHLRQVNQIGFWFCFGALAFATYLQYFNALSPCPLCIAQRLMIGLLCLLFLLGSLHLYQGGARILHGVCIVFCSLLGAALAGRQIWLEQLPATQAPPCGPGFSYMIEHLPFHEIFMALLQGTAECAEVSWRLLGLTIPVWTSGLFGLFIVLGLWSIMHKDEK